MREFLTSDDICNEISMERTVFDGAFVLVEGVTDSRLFGKFIDKDSVKISIAHSRDNAERVVKEMRNRGDRKVMGIIDPDLDRLKGKKAKPPLFYTDCRDMEMMAVRSHALDDVLDEYGDRESVARFNERFGHVRDVLVTASYPIGLLMHVSQERGLGLSFKDLDFDRFINPRSLGLDARTMVSEVVDNSRTPRISKKNLLKVLGSEAEALGDPWLAARGHDTISILLIGLRKGFGGTNVRGLDEGVLGGALRLAFSDEDFASTDLYRDTKEWAASGGMVLWDLTRSGSPRS